MGLSPPLVVFLVILGASFLCAMGYAVHIRFGTNDEDKSRLNPLVEQEQYMRQVRQRNFNWMRDYCRANGIRRPPPQNNTSMIRLLSNFSRVPSMPLDFAMDRTAFRHWKPYLSTLRRRHLITTRKPTDESTAALGNVSIWNPKLTLYDIQEFRTGVRKYLA
ncbi:gb [Venturia nashicola]|uniref:Gb n=1 Tax=Venturia nashicola TaxID=86259 RepID=A0A4Z1PAI1_9PEZI|nr:gb [Venturia nashicola]TLD27592.1 gb [Venturia nashicola]